MSKIEIERLIGDLTDDNALRDRLKGVGDDFDAALATVRDAGYAIDADEARAWLAALAVETRQELNDEKLDAVTGGAASPDVGNIFSHDINKPKPNPSGPFGGRGLTGIW